MNGRPMLMHNEQQARLLGLLFFGLGCILLADGYRTKEKPLAVRLLGPILGG